MLVQKLKIIIQIHVLVLLEIRNVFLYQVGSPWMSPVRAQLLHGQKKNFPFVNYLPFKKQIVETILQHGVW